jgi:hypothetical protein
MLRPQQYVRLLKKISGRPHLREPPVVNYLAGRKCTIYVVRVGGSGHIRKSDPCKSCSRLIKQFGIKKIVYSNDDGGFDVVNASDYESQHCSSGFNRINKLNI